MVVYRRGTVMDVYTASCDLVVPQLSHVHSHLAASNVQRNAAGLQILVLDVDPDAEHGYDRLLELEATSTTFYHTTLYPCRPVSEARTKLVDFQSGGRDIREHPRTKRM